MAGWPIHKLDCVAGQCSLVIASPSFVVAGHGAAPLSAPMGTPRTSHHLLSRRTMTMAGWSSAVTTSCMTTSDGLGCLCPIELGV